MSALVNRQTGAVTLIGALFIIMVVAIMGLVVNRMAGSNITDTGAQNDTVGALFVTESGIEFASFMYANGTPCTNLAAAINATAVGRGEFDVTNSLLAGTDCRITVQGRVSSVGAVAPNTALRTVTADLRLSADNVVAVGNNGTILRWEGANWNPEISGTTQDLRSVYCPSSSECWAVGGNRIILHWTGGDTWSTRFISSDGSLNGVSCEPNNPSNCYAVGLDIVFKGRPDTETMHWDGFNWTNNGGASPFNWHEDIACPDANCYAVTINGPTFTSSSNWSNDFLKATDAQHGIDCFGGVDCWSVGDKPSDNTFRFYRRSAAGRSSIDLNSTEAGNLRSVSCSNAANCKAVGDWDGPRFTVVRWNGNNWASESFSHNNREDLNGVHCSAPDNCWAVGKFRSGRATGNSLFWDGATWNYVGTPVLEDLNDVFIIDASGGGGGAVSLVRWQELIN